MKRIFIAFIVLFCINDAGYAQFTIDDCRRKAKDNYPLIKRYELIEKSKDYNLSNAGKGYLPQFSMSAKATYQSEVTGLPIVIPGKVGLTKDQYNATLDMNQVIWDGGVIRTKKEISKTAADVERKQLDVDMYAINDRVNQLFFGILLLDAKLKQNTLLQEELQRNHTLISSYIQNGIANQADLDAVKVEQLKALQASTQLKTNKKAYLEMLASMIGEAMDENIVLQNPDTPDLLVPTQINRPELQLFEAYNKNLEAQKKMIKTDNMPKLGLFMTGGIGRPGLNMLDGGFSPYYIGGVRVSWNFGGLYTQNNNRKLIEVNQHSFDYQKETFLFNANLDTSREQQEVNKNRELLKYDDEIISLRSNVKKSTEAKVANGTLTVIDLMRDVNSEDMAKQDKIQHETELLLSIYNLKFTTNN